MGWDEDVKKFRDKHPCGFSQPPGTLTAAKPVEQSQPAPADDCKTFCRLFAEAQLQETYQAEKCKICKEVAGAERDALAEQIHELKAVLCDAKRFVQQAHDDAESRHDSDGELYMGSVQYEIMEETERLLERIEQELRRCNEANT